MAFPKLTFSGSYEDTAKYPTGPRSWRSFLMALHNDTEDYLNNQLLPLIDLPNSPGYSGYYKLPNGFIIQWGNGVATSANQWLPTNLPIAFPNACLIAVGNSVSIGSHGGAGKDGASKTSINIWGTNVGTNINYIAIGY